MNKYDFKPWTMEEAKQWAGIPEKYIHQTWLDKVNFAKKRLHIFQLRSELAKYSDYKESMMSCWSLKKLISELNKSMKAK